MKNRRIGYKYFLLKEGDIIQKGDEYQAIETKGKWFLRPGCRIS